MSGEAPRPKSLRETIGPVTPAKLIGLSMFAVGVIILLASKWLPGDTPGWWSGIALLLIGASFFADTLLPGGSKFSPEQLAMMEHMKIPVRAGMERWFNIIVGTLIIAGGLYLVGAF